MPQYIGFSTINANKPKTTNANIGVDGGPGNLLKPIIFGKKFRLVDQPLVIQDLVNALNIPQGQKVGQPQYGTTLWNFIFDPNTADVKLQLQNELRRVIALDPRLQLNDIAMFSSENGILVELQLAISPFNQEALLSLFFNSATNSVSINS